VISPPNIGLFDIYLSSFFVLIAYFICFRIQRQKIGANKAYSYFLFGLSAKIVGAVVFALVSIYYYKGGDTFRYFQVAENLRYLFYASFDDGIDLFFTSFNAISDADYFELGFPNRYYEKSSTWFFSRIVFVFNTITFGSYLASSILISVVSFIGLWLGYSAFIQIYSGNIGLLFIPFFLVPTALFWSSGILRDTIIIGSFGVVLYSGVNLFIFKKNLLLHSLIFLLALGFILFLKPILFFVLLPCLVVWMVLSFIAKNFYFKNILRYAIFGALTIIILVFFVNTYVLDENSKYKLTHLMITLKGFHTIHPDYPVAASAYNLGEINYTFFGAIKKVPEAINVTFFRPYFWEINGFSTFLAALEAFVLFGLFVYVLILRKNIFQFKGAIFLFLFSIMYAAVAGIAAYNFGALTRFKIPAVLTFTLLLVIACAQKNESKQH